MKKNILITGGLGILGAALVKKLNKQNFILWLFPYVILVSGGLIILYQFRKKR